MLKRAIFVFLLVSSQLFALELTTASSYAVAVQVAKKDNKNILLMLSQSGCQACIYAKTVMLKNEEVVGLLKNFIVIEVNIHQDEWNKKFRAFGTPTIYLLDKNENKLIRPIVGALEPPDFAKVVRDLEGTKK